MSEIVFSDRSIDRLGALRNDPSALEAARTHPETRFVIIWRRQCLVHETRIALLTSENVAAYTPSSQSSTFLGKRGECCLFALAIDSEDTPDLGAELHFAGLRDISSRLEPTDAALAAFARAMVAWQTNHQYCGVCGAHCDATEGGFVMACTSAPCNHRTFPRLDPAVIILAHRDEHALLGRQGKWPNQRFSTIAGFVEPGESLEDAIHREIREETNIEVADTQYVASQPWPFPAALMIGFHARAISDDIKLNDGELAEARWASRQDIISGQVILPPKISVAYHLIESWFNQYDGPPLAALKLPEVPFSTPRQSGK